MHRLFDGQGHSELYAQFRPIYPQAVVDTVLDFAKKTNQQPPFDQILDVGCGNGQATRMFASHTQKITASDVSENQIKQAKAANKDPHVEYLVGKGEELRVDDSSVDIIISGQAIHWVDHDKFFAECERVLKPNGFVVLFGYTFPNFISVGDCRDMDANKRKENSKRSGESHRKAMSMLPWHPKTKLVENRYDSIFKMMPSSTKTRIDDIKISRTLTLDEIYKYECTGSGYQTHMENARQAVEKSHGKVTKEELRKYDVVADFIDDLRTIWDVHEDNNAVEVLIEEPIFILLSYRPYK